MIIINLIVVLYLSGCSLELEPQNLIESPMIEQEQLEIKRAAMKFMPKSGRYAIPVEAKGANSINLIDLDNDSVDEIVVFYEAMEDYFKTGAYILKKVDDKWKRIDQIEGNGLYLLSAQFKDILGDSKKEIIFCWYLGEDQYKDLEIYSMDNGRFVRSGEIRCSDYEIGDLNYDLKDEIVAVKLDSQKNEYLAELYSFSKEGLKKTNEVPINSISKKIRKISFGKINKNMNAVIIDFDAGIKSSYTNIFFMENGIFKKAFEDNNIENLKTFQVFPLGSYDIDGDGLIEIGIPIGIFAEKSPSFYLEYIESWYNWDLKMKLKKQYYVDEESGYKIEIPESWYANFSLKKTYGKDENITTFYYIGKDINYMKELTSIYVVDSYNLDNIRALLTREGRKYEIIEKSMNKIYIKVEPRNKDLEYLSIETKYEKNLDSIKNIKEHFTLLEN